MARLDDRQQCIQIWPDWTTNKSYLPLRIQKYLHWVMMVSTVFVGCLLENYSEYFEDFLALR